MGFFVCAHTQPSLGSPSDQLSIPYSYGKQQPTTTLSTERGERDGEQEEVGDDESDGSRLVVTVASCSFYDNVVATWQMDVDVDS